MNLKNMSSSSPYNYLYYLLLDIGFKRVYKTCINSEKKTIAVHSIFSHIEKGLQLRYVQLAMIHNRN